jgi:hypothetical protein
VIFGASGDLTARKLLPALERLAAYRALSAEVGLIGVARTPMIDARRLPARTTCAGPSWWRTPGTCTAATTTRRRTRGWPTCNTEIAADLRMGERTVKSHVSAILTKLDSRDRAMAIVVAFDAGREA